MIRFSLKFSNSNFQTIVQRVAYKEIKTFLGKVAARMRVLMRLPKTGRFYGRQRASGPGEAPAIRSGRLIQSIGTPTVNGLRGSLQISAPYAGYLELGTKSIAPRPFAEPAIKGVLDEIKRGGTLSNLL